MRSDKFGRVYRPVYEKANEEKQRIKFFER